MLEWEAAEFTGKFIKLESSRNYQAKPSYWQISFVRELKVSWCRVCMQLLSWKQFFMQI